MQGKNGCMLRQGSHLTSNADDFTADNGGISMDERFRNKMRVKVQKQKAAAAIPVRKAPKSIVARISPLSDAPVELQARSKTFKIAERSSSTRDLSITAHFGRFYRARMSTTFASLDQ